MTGPNGKSSTSSTGRVLPKPKAEVEVGVSAFLPFVTPYQNAWEAWRDDQVTVRQLKAMRETDGQARALYRLITLPIRAALRTATYMPESQVDGGDDEATFIEQMLTLPASAGGMTVSFNAVIAQLLLAVFHGFSAFELVYWVPTRGPLKGKWTLKKIAARPPETLTFLLDDKSEFAGFRQRTIYQSRSVDVVIPPEHSFYYACNEEEKPFYGQSYFISAFHHWDKKFRLYTIAHIAAQRAAVGTRVGTMPKSPSRDEKDDFKKALSDLGVAQWMTIPDDYKVESLREAGTFDFLSYINHHNSQMSKSVLAAFFDDSQGTGGDASLIDFGRQSDALFMMMLNTIMGEVEEVVNNKIIPRFIDWNFGTGKYPKFQFGSLTEEQKAAIVDIFKTLAVAGQSLTISPEFVHELEKEVADSIGLEIDWETVEAEQAEEKQRLADMAAQGGIDPATGQPAAPGAMPPPAAAPGGHPLVDPSLLPKGFTLSDVDGDPVGFTDYARELLVEAIDNLELTRGKTISGGPKIVRTAEGARVYGVPIGTPITRDMEHKAGNRGVEGKSSGAAHIKDKGSTRKVLGGGLGDRSGQRGPGVDAVATMIPKRTFSNPKQPGAQLLDFGDGTVAVKDANGNISPRQKFDVGAFAILGWQVDAAAGGVTATTRHRQSGGREAEADAKAKAARAATKRRR